MELYFQEIKKKTDLHNNFRLVKKYIERLLFIITENYRDYINIAADQGRDYAFLFVYKRGGKTSDGTPIDNLLFPESDIYRLCVDNNYPGVLDQLREKFRPFQIKTEEIVSDKTGTKFMTIKVGW